MLSGYAGLLYSAVGFAYSLFILKQERWTLYVVFLLFFWFGFFYCRSFHRGPQGFASRGNTDD